MANLTPPIDVDLDLLRRLARDDVAAFEALRARLVGQFIESAPAAYQRRLRGVQFRADQVRKLAKTPLAATIRLSELMWESFLALNHELSTAPTTTAARPVVEATIIPLRRTGTRDA